MSSPDTAAAPPETPDGAPPEARREATGPAAPPHGRRLRRTPRPGRGWALLTAAAAVLFCVALVLGAMRLHTDVGEITDTPEHTVDAFLEALLGQRDASAAAAWLCADKADRDLGAAVASMSFTSGPGSLAWGEVTETGRSVGAATVTAEIRMDGGDAASAPTTWVFSLVAEKGDPQWLICGIAAE
ncbi:hypothetical protein LO763_12455 [Glycomyces sp. A-F 0318]|uniref:hypothetical protein n=1 Tax=Glycomyces amatae TaxID=2881355 RepID=UPI001E563036|nr:hypothetical protein [Glycomyces amatae]MCD0444431.1 hypothetical protein [Glycomyces amatae]